MKKSINISVNLDSKLLSMRWLSPWETVNVYFFVLATWLLTSKTSKLSVKTFIHEYIQMYIPVGAGKTIFHILNVASLKLQKGENRE